MERKKKVERETKTLFLISPITEINKKYIDPCKDNFLGNFYEKKKKKEKTSWTLEKIRPFLEPNFSSRRGEVMISRASRAGNTEESDLSSGSREGSPRTEFLLRLRIRFTEVCGGREADRNGERAISTPRDRSGPSNVFPCY